MSLGARKYRKVSQQQVKDAIATLPKKYTKYHPKVPTHFSNHFTSEQFNCTVFFGTVHILVVATLEESDEEVYNYNKTEWQDETIDCQALLNKDTDQVELLSNY